MNRQRNHRGRFLPDNNIERQNFIQIFWDNLVYMLNTLIYLISILPWILLLLFCLKYLNVKKFLLEFLEQSICSYVQKSNSNGDDKKGYF